MAISLTVNAASFGLISLAGVGLMLMLPQIVTNGFLEIKT
jgi:hypothetical protein